MPHTHAHTHSQTMVNQDPFETNLKVLVQHAHELPTGHFRPRQSNDSTGKPTTAHSSRSSVLEADRLRRGLRLERLHLGRADRGRDAVRERLVDRREHRHYARDLVSVTGWEGEEGRGKRDVRWRALTSALFAFLRCMATLCTRCSRSVSLKTFWYSTRGCSKSTVKVTRHTPCQPHMSQRSDRRDDARSVISLRSACAVPRKTSCSTDSYSLGLYASGTMLLW